MNRQQSDRSTVRRIIAAEGGAWIQTSDRRIIGPDGLPEPGVYRIMQPGEVAEITGPEEETPPSPARRAQAVASHSRASTAADRQHKHRDLWVGLAIALTVGGPTLALTVWAAEQGTAHVSFWPHAGEVAGVLLTGLGIFLCVAVVLGWPLPGGFTYAEHTQDTPASPAHTEDTRIPALLDLITEGKMLGTQVPPQENWMITDRYPVHIYRGLAAWDERASDVLERGWLEQFKNEPEASVWVALKGPNAIVDYKIKSRLRVLETLVQDLRERSEG